MLIDHQSLKKELTDILDRFNDALKKVKTGKANIQDIEDIQVEAYGGTSPLKGVAQVMAEDAMNLKVVVWDKGVMQAVEQAIRNASTGGSVAMDRDIIRIAFSPMTEEDRKKRVKEIGQLAEDYRIRVRQVRQQFMKDVDQMEGVSEDEQERDRKTIQEEIDVTIDKIDTMLATREEQLMKV